MFNDNYFSKQIGFIDNETNSHIVVLGAELATSSDVSLRIRLREASLFCLNHSLARKVKAEN